MVWAVLGILVVAGAAWWWLRRNAATDVTSAPQVASHVAPRAAKPKTWGKRLVVPADFEACAVAHEHAGKCYTHAEAPSLPLAGCTNSNCRCHYEELPERRQGGERRNGHERRQEIRFDQEHPDRRSGTDRRKDTYHWESGV